MQLNCVEQGIVSIFQGVDCILACETAADFLGISNGCLQRRVYIVYAKQELGLPDVQCILVDSYDGIAYEERLGILCTTPEQTIMDLIVNDRDDQVIYESMADWYFTHGETFDGLVVPDGYQELFDWYAEGAKDYYNMGN